MEARIGDQFTSLEEYIHLSTLLSTETNWDNLTEMIVTSAQQLTNAEGGIIYLLDDLKRILIARLFQSSRVNIPLVEFSHVPLYRDNQWNMGNAIAYCAFTGNVINIADIHKYTGFDFEEFYRTDRSYQFKVQSLMIVSLRDHEALTIGVLLLFNYIDSADGQVKTFPERLNRVAKAFASHAAVAMDNALLIQRNKRLIDILNNTNQELETENKQLRNKIQSRYDFSRIIGHASSMQRVFDLMGKVLESDATVLIRGETGTGKELIANAIHYNSRRQSHEFVAQNCAAVPENLLESELFGYCKGAFTGANSDKRGLIELADKGTLFLDEIGDMPLGLQAKLLRVLQEREVRPLGGSASIKVNVRVIAATHGDLTKKIQQGEFREDLYYRLSVFPIELPALRQRKEDLPQLLQYFLELFCKNHGKKISSYSPIALDLLLQYEYPGNIRELRNVVERAVLLCDNDANTGGNILAEHLPPAVTGIVPESSNLQKMELPDLKGELKLIVDTFEATVIRKILQECRGNQSKAARRLGIGRRTMLSKMNRYQIKH